MKTIKLYSLLLGFLISGLTLTVRAQNGGCVQCSGCTATGNNASAIGNNSIASGNNAFAGGYGSQASGSNSLAFGYNSKATQNTNMALGNNAQATGISSAAIGVNVKATAQNSFAFGAGTTTNYPLTNSTPYSIAFGVNSNKPTMLITKSMNNNYTGKVAIGQLTSPQTKLHIKADSNEDAGLFLEPTNKNTTKAFIQLFDNEHSITVGKTGSMDIDAGSGNVNFRGDHYCFGNAQTNKVRIYTDGGAALYYNVFRDKSAELRENEGIAFAIDFSEGAMRFRSAFNQLPRGAEITNWAEPLRIGTDGKITLTGKIGINTDKEVNGYALAVNGGLISTKVYIKEVNHWPDHVFSESYPLLELGALKDYLHEHRHLPGVPSEAEIVENGYDLHEMQYIMMEKIEEMTRYILLLQDEIEALRSKAPQDNRTVRFAYDANGNRIARYLEFKRVTDPTQPVLVPAITTYDLFPNPTPGEFTVVVKETLKDAPLHVKLLTASGVILDEREVTESQAVFDLSHQADGIYLLEVGSPEGTHSWKVIKRQP